MLKAREKELVTFIIERLDASHESIGVLYYQMLTMSLDPAEDLHGSLGYAYDTYIKETKSTEGQWFYDFHKSMRNTDFYAYNDTAYYRVNGTKKESIAGKLNGILWHLIHVDTKDFLYKFLVESFEAFKTKKKVARKFGLHQR